VGGCTCCSVSLQHPTHHHASSQFSFISPCFHRPLLHSTFVYLCSHFHGAAHVFHHCAPFVPGRLLRGHGAPRGYFPLVLGICIRADDQCGRQRCPEGHYSGIHSIQHCVHPLFIHFCICCITQMEFLVPPCACCVERSVGRNFILRV